MKERKSKEQIMSEMDDAADEARDKFEEIQTKYPRAVAELSTWWEENFRMAGHKRLARILLEYKIE